ncbi:MAG: hypothetical protein AAFO89_00500 [Planctomycetota bacterium]
MDGFWTGIQIGEWFAKRFDSKRQLTLHEIAVDEFRDATAHHMGRSIEQAQEAKPDPRRSKAFKQVVEKAGVSPCGPPWVTRVCLASGESHWVTVLKPIGDTPFSMLICRGPKCGSVYFITTKTEHITSVEHYPYMVLDELFGNESPVFWKENDLYKSPESGLAQMEN